jgi:hypothetical protein
MSRDVARNLILLGGAIHVGAALFHVALPWISGWRELVGVLPTSRQGALYVFNASVVCTFVLFAILSLGFSHDLAGTPLGRATAMTIAGFWAARAGAEVVLEPTASALILGFCVATGLLYAAASLASPIPPA